jgi:hypothetical protein
VDDPDNHIFPISPVFGQAIGGGPKLVPRWFEWGGKSGRGNTTVPAAQSVWGYAGRVHAYNRPLNKLLYKAGMRRLNDTSPETEIVDDQQLDLQIYKCPADTGYTAKNYPDYGMSNLRESGLSCYDHYGNSYTGAAFIVCLSTGSGCVSDLPIFSTSPFYRPLSRIPNGANTILFYEGNASRAYRGYDASKPITANPCNEPPLDEEIVKGWHGKDWFFTCCFVDGHSSVIKMKGMTVPPPHLGATYPDIPGRDPYQYWGCITIRGSGWQMDSLPAPTIELPLTAGEAGF